MGPSSFPTINSIHSTPFAVSSYQSSRLSPHAPWAVTNEKSLLPRQSVWQDRERTRGDRAQERYAQYLVDRQSEGPPIFSNNPTFASQGPSIAVQASSFILYDETISAVVTAFRREQESELAAWQAPPQHPTPASSNPHWNPATRTLSSTAPFVTFSRNTNFSPVSRRTRSQTPTAAPATQTPPSREPSAASASASPSTVLASISNKPSKYFSLPLVSPY